MQTYKEFEIAGQLVVISHAAAITSGYGHKKITVELTEDFSGKSEKFTATTSNMPGYDAASELEGQDKYEALYELIALQIEEQVYEWLQ